LLRVSLSLGTLFVIARKCSKNTRPVLPHAIEKKTELAAEGTDTRKAELAVLIRQTTKEMVSIIM
jgi:hypothetical protein